MVMEANGMGSKMMAVDAKMRSPEGEQFRHDVLVNKALGTGQNADLGDYAANVGMYG